VHATVTEQPTYQQYPQSYDPRVQQAPYAQMVPPAGWVAPTPVRTIANDELAVRIKSVQMTWGDMFVFQFKWWVVGTVYGIAAFILWIIVVAAIVS
jgi:hypothetical protein